MCASSRGSEYQHRVAVAVKSVSIDNSGSVRGQQPLATRKGGDQHEQRRPWQMKVGQQSADDPEIEPWKNEEVGLPRARRDASTVRARHGLERPRRRRPDGDDAAARIERPVDRGGGDLVDRVMLRLDAM